MCRAGSIKLTTAAEQTAAGSQMVPGSSMRRAAWQLQQQDLYAFSNDSQAGARAGGGRVTPSACSKDYCPRSSLTKTSHTSLTRVPRLRSRDLPPHRQTGAGAGREAAAGGAGGVRVFAVGGVCRGRGRATSGARRGRRGAAGRRHAPGAALARHRGGARICAPPLLTLLW